MDLLVVLIDDGFAVKMFVVFLPMTFLHRQIPTFCLM